MAYTPKGLALAVLRSVPELGPEACGTEIRDLLHNRLNQDVSTQTVYLALQRLEERGLLASHEETAEERALRNATGRRGHPRRIYELTTSGRAAIVDGVALFRGPMAEPSGRSLGSEEAEGGIVGC